MEIRENISLKDYSTFKIGGVAKSFCIVKTLEDLQQAIKWARDKNQKIFVLGGGSNILFPDEGLDGLVVKVQNQELERVDLGSLGMLGEGDAGELGGEGLFIGCGAGVSLAKLVDFAAKNNLTGLEWAAGIPGAVGGAVRGNAGAFGGEMKDSIVEIQVIDLDNLEDESEWTKKYSKEQCQFGYRSSVFKKKKNLIIWSCIFELKKGKKDEIESRILEIKKSRSEKHPNLKDFPSCGSFFQNPVAPKDIVEKFEKDKNVQSRGGKVPAGWLIEEAGLKGLQVGGAQISNKQANFIVNTKDATQKEVLVLASIAKEKVRNKFRVQLKEEVEIVY